MSAIQPQFRSKAAIADPQGRPSGRRWLAALALAISLGLALLVSGWHSPVQAQNSRAAATATSVAADPSTGVSEEALATRQLAEDSLALASTENAVDTGEPARLSDAALEAEIAARLARAVIGQDGFTFSVQTGTVYWQGSTTVAQHKGAATRMARSAGAREVINRIEVVSASPAPSSDDSPQALRRAQVQWREKLPDR